MNNNIISIIIPVYNGEKYINRCLDKVLNINLKKEIIVINDGSSDNSLNLLNNYNEEIIIINSRKNKGVSHARNLGIRKATGNYVTFIDVDDDFDVNMHKIMIDRMIREGSDLSFCEFDVIKNNKTYKSRYSYNFGKSSKEQILINYLTDRIFPSVWSSVYSSILIKSIQFEEKLDVGEDVLFMLRCLLSSKKPIFLNEVLYHYCQNNNSQLHNINESLIQDIYVKKYIPSKDADFLIANFPEEYKFFELQMMYRAINAVSLAYKIKTRKLCISLLKKIYDKGKCNQLIKNKYTPKHIKIELFVLAHFGIKFHFLVFPFYKLMRYLSRK